MITRGQVADLQAGDVVQVTYADGYSFQGPAVDDGYGGLRVGPNMVRDAESEPAPWMTAAEHTLTVLTRAPRPLYVNHPRTEAAYGDVVDDPEGHEPGVGPWLKGRGDDWYSPAGKTITPVPRGWRLLVDGETGQVVQ